MQHNVKTTSGQHPPNRIHWLTILPNLLQDFNHFTTSFKTCLSLVGKAQQTPVACLAAACQAGAVATLLTCVTAASGNASVASKSLHVMKSLLAVDSNKDAFMRAGGANQLAELLSHQSCKLAASHVHCSCD